jgi:DNA mismatch endonuclease (patch repair protein)
MSRVRQHGTSLELKVRSAVKNLGLSYSTSAKGLPGSPDLFNRSDEWAIFVNGCFWHGHASCPHGRLPKTNYGFWKAKIRSNSDRDQLKKHQLENFGYRVLTIWECELKDSGMMDSILRRFFNHSRLVGKNRSPSHYEEKYESFPEKH